MDQGLQSHANAAAGPPIPQRCLQKQPFVPVFECDAQAPDSPVESFAGRQHFEWLRSLSQQQPILPDQHFKIGQIRCDARIDHYSGRRRSCSTDQLAYRFR